MNYLTNLLLIVLVVYAVLVAAGGCQEFNPAELVETLDLQEWGEHFMTVAKQNGRKVLRDLF